MSLVTCPRCRAPNDAQIDASGRFRCAVCDHTWTDPTAALTQSAVASPPPVNPRKSKDPRLISQEYMPDEPANDPVRALTNRHSENQSMQSPLPIKRPMPPPADLKPHSDRSHGGVIPPLKMAAQSEQPRAAKPLPDAAPVVTSSTPTVELDMDLFDRLESEAQVSRSRQNTMPEIPPDPPPQAVPGSDRGIACPVCGHGFVPPDDARAQTCPQCHTTFDHASGRITNDASGAKPIDPLLGRNLRGCLIDRKVGEGGMGSVYHARQLSLERSVAIKVLPPDLARNRNFIQRFEREAKSLARINHPNILHIYDFGEEPALQLYFMIIEFVDGKDLGEMINRRHTMPQLEVLDLLRQAAMGLEMAAEKGVIHRDIKPDNLMIAESGTCKVSDFGLAKGYGDENEVTSIGVRVGTPAFMSPEQCDGVEVDFRSDVYNLGCTAYLCLTGRLPFDGETPFSIMLKHKNDPIPSIRDVMPSVDPRVDRLVQRMLAKKPDDRCLAWRNIIDEIENLQVEIAGTNSILRKSRGALHAMTVNKDGSVRPVLDPHGQVALPPAAVPKSPPGLAPIRDTTPPADAYPLPMPGGQAGQVPEWLRPIDSARLVQNQTPPAQPARPPTGPMPAVAGSPLPQLPGGNAAGASAGNAGQLPMLPPSPQPGAAAPIGAKSNILPPGPTPVLRGSGAMAAPLGSGIGAGPTSSGPLAPGAARPLAPSSGDLRVAVATVSPENTRTRSGKRLDTELELARERGLGREAEALAVSGDRLVAAGRLRDAAREFRRASEIAPNPDRAAELSGKAVAADRQANSRRTWQRVGYALFVLVMLVTVAVMGPPIVHNYMVSRDLAKAEAVDDPKNRLERLDEIAASVPPSWYVYGYHYTITAAEKAKQEAADLRKEIAKAAVQAPVQPSPLIALTVLFADPNAPYNKVMDLANDVLAKLPPAGSEHDRARDIRDQMVDLKGKMTPEVDYINAMRKEGRHAEALARAKTFRATYPRAGQLADDLPLPASVHITSSDGTAITDFQVLVDGRPLGPGETTFSRRANQDTMVEVDSPGYAPVTRDVPASTDQAEKVVEVVLKVAELWSRHLGRGPSWATLHVTPDGVIVQRSDGSTLLRPADGEVVATLDPPPGASLPAYGTLWLVDNGHVITSTQDGDILDVDPHTLQVNQTLHRGGHTALAWLPVALTYHAGTTYRYVVEDFKGARSLVAFDNETEKFRYRGVAGKLVPLLLHHGDRIVVLDDTTLHFLEEDFSGVQMIDLFAQRTGDPLVSPDGNTLFVPTAAGVQWLTLGGRTNAVVTTPDPLLASAGPALIAGDGDTLVLAGDNHVLQLAQVQAGSLKLLWSAHSDNAFALPPAITDSLVITVDDQGRITSWDRATGTKLGISAHGSALACPPVVVDGHIIVIDENGGASAYAVPKPATPGP